MFGLRTFCILSVLHLIFDFEIIILKPPYKGNIMKNLIAVVLLLSLIVAAPLFANVHTRLQFVNNESGILVIDVQAMSDDGIPLVSQYRGAFKIAETLEKRVVAVGFQNFVFQNEEYEELVGYSSDYRKVTWVYNIREDHDFSAIPEDWTTVLRVVIVYNIGDENATVTWAGSPSYLVEDENGTNITGDYLPIPSELQDFPLPVEMTAYSATRQENAIELNWRTESELNNLGFNIYRSEQAEEGYSLISDELVRGQGTTTAAHDYSYIDDTIESDKDYWYTIETVSTDGVSTYYGPMAASTMSDIDMNLNATPAEFALMQNYPNPFNPSTEIRYQLAKSTKTTLSIYDVRGQRVKQLISGIQDAGAYTVVWNGLDATGARVNSGIYIYELKAGAEVFYKKMTMIK